MIDRDKLKDILTEYKRDFPQRWPLEKYKWEAVRCFQTAWDFTVRVERFREDAEHIRREYVRHLEAALSEIERHQYVFVAPLSRPVLPVQLFRLPCRSERTP